MGTDTPGVGYCAMHRQAEVVTGQAVVAVSEQGAKRLAHSSERAGYRMTRSTRLGEIADDMGFDLRAPRRNAAGHVELDLSGELAAARAMLAFFMETFAEREDALLLWADAYEAGDLRMKPPRPLTVTEGHKAALAIAQLAKTMHEMQQSVPRATFMRVMTRMGESVEAHVVDPATRRKIRDDFIAATAELVVGG